MTLNGLLALLGVLLALVVVGGAWARACERNIAQYRAHRDRFFLMASALIKDDACPVPLAFTLRQIGATLNEGSVLGRVAVAAVTSGRTIRTPHGPLWELFQKSPVDVRGRFTAAAREACIAVSYRSVVLGGMIRRSIQGRDHKPESADQAAIAQLVRAGEKHPPPEYAERFGRRLCTA